jgi:glutathione S-transferase
MKYGYYPLDLNQQFECDMLADYYGEIFLDLVIPVIAPADEAKKAAGKTLFAGRLPFVMKFLGPRRVKGGWLVGNRMSTADFLFGNIYASIANNQNSYARSEWAAWLKANTDFEKYGKRFCSENSKWLAKRQAYPLS